MESHIIGLNVTPRFHMYLLGCLSSWFGVGGVVLEWFKSYLSDRLQCVKIGSILSGAKKLLCYVSGL